MYMHVKKATVSLHCILQLKSQAEIDTFLALVYQYLPSVLITVMYAIFPVLFKKLATLERYYPATEQNITIARWVKSSAVTLIYLISKQLRVVGLDWSILS